MKKKSLFFVLLMIVFAVGCSSDDDNISQPGDDNGNDEGETPTESLGYFPDSEGNTWTYGNEMLLNLNDEETERSATEVLTLTENNNDEFSFESEVDEDAPGLFTTALSNGTLKKVDSQYLYTGNLGLLDFEELPAIDIPLENIPFFNENAAAGEELYTAQGEASQEVPMGELGTYPVLVSYTLSVTQAEDYDKMMDYNDIKSTTIKISNVSILLQDIPAIGELELVENTENEAVVATNYFAKDVGLIKSETSLDLPLVDLNEVIPLPLDGIPDLGTVTAFMSQTLLDYQLTE